MRLTITAILLIVLLCGSSRAQEDQALSLCVSLAKTDIRDTNYVYNDQTHYEQYKSLLKQTHLDDYGQYKDFAGKAGLNIPIADGIIGFSGNAKDDASVFRKQMDEFLTSTYQERADHIQQVSDSSKLNSEILSVIDHCNMAYFTTLKDLVEMRVEIVPSDYSTFQVTVDAKIPAAFKLRITAIEPATLVHCTQNGSPVTLNVDLPTNQALMTCTKDPDQNIDFQVQSNVDVSKPINVPAVPKPLPALPSNPPTPSVAINWQNELPSVQTIIASPCLCLHTESAIDPQNDIKTITATNGCPGSVSLVGARDENPMFLPFIPIVERQGRQFVTVSLPEKSKAIFSGSNGTHLQVMITACPDVGTAQPYLRCLAEPEQPPFANCEVSGKSLGDTCTCSIPGGPYQGQAALFLFPPP